MPSKTPIFADGCDYFYAERVAMELPAEIMEALQRIQKSPRCKGKVATLEIESNGRYYEIMPRQRIHAIGTRYIKDQIKEDERLLLKMLR